MSGVAEGSYGASSSGDDLKRSRLMLERRFDDFVGVVMEAALDEMEPLRVVSGHSLPGNSAAKSVAGPIIESEVERFHRSIGDQFDVVLDYAEAEARGESYDFGSYESEFLDNDVFIDSCRDPSIRDDLVERIEVMGEDMCRMMETGEETFWDAAYEAFDVEEALELVNYHFGYSDTLREYEPALQLEAEVGRGPFSASFEYTDEALRVIEHGEASLRDRLELRVEEVF